MNPILKQSERSFAATSVNKMKIVEESEQNSHSKCHKFMVFYVESTWANVISIIMTFLVLYLDDIRLGFTTKSADVYVDTVFLV